MLGLNDSIQFDCEATNVDRLELDSNYSCRQCRFVRASAKSRDDQRAGRGVCRWPCVFERKRRLVDAHSRSRSHERWTWEIYPGALFTPLQENSAMAQPEITWRRVSSKARARRWLGSRRISGVFFWDFWEVPV